MPQVSPILLAVIAIFLGSVVDALVKGATAEIAVLTLTAWRYLFGAILLLSIYRWRQKPMPTIRAITFHAFRGGIQMIAALSFFYGLTQLGLAEATVLGFTAALMVPPLAQLILKEKMSLISVGASIIGFLGAVVAVSGIGENGPAGGNKLHGVASVMLAAFTYALTIVLLRLRSRTEDSLTIVMFSNLMPAIFCFILLGIVAPMHGQVPFGLTLSQVPWVVTIAVLGVATWYVFTEAYARAPAQRIAPIEYTALIWSAVLGYVFFAEMPGWQLFAGAAVIIVACLIVAFESHFATRKATHLPTSDVLD